MTPLRILHVEDSPDDAELIRVELQRLDRPVETLRVETRDALRDALIVGGWDIVLSDWSLPRLDGLGALAVVQELARDLPFILVSGTVGEESAVSAIRAGAHDFVLKARLGRLVIAIERELRDRDVRRARFAAERAHETAQRRIRQMVDSAMVGFWFVDVRGDTTFMNARMAEILGVSTEEKDRVLASEFFDADRVDMPQRLADLAAGRAPRYEQRFLRKDGTVGWAFVESSPLRDDDGSDTGVLSMVTDITDRRRAEDALREADLRFRRLVEAGIVGVTVADSAGTLVEANDRYLEMIGRNKADLEARALRCPARGADPDEQRATLEELRQTGRAGPRERVVRRGDGTAVRLLVAFAQLDADRILGLTVDVTDRDHAEHRRAAVVTAALDAVVIVNQRGHITEWNPAAERTFGYAAAEVLGRSIADVIVPPALRDDHLRGFGRDAATGDSTLLGTRIEITAMRRGGATFPVELSITRADLDGTTSFVAYIRDIEERKRIEQELLARMRIAALGRDVGVALTGEGTLADNLQRCCQAIVNHLGATFARIWRMAATDDVLELQASAGIYTHLDGAHARVRMGAAKIGRIAADRRPHLTNDVLIDPFVDREWARREGLQAFAGHPLLVGGEVVGVLAMFSKEPLSDVTLKGFASIADAIAVRIRGKAAEDDSATLVEQLRQSQKMEAIGRLAGGVAHDFNNLLSVILGYSDLLLEDLTSDAPMRETVEEIRHAGRRASDLTRQLLTFSRQQVFEPKVVDLDALLASLDKMLQRLVGEDVELATRSARALGRVRVDPGSFEQVVMNLVVNARDAMPKGGRLSIETANVELDEAYARSHFGAKPGSYVMLSVTDTGTGMDKATLARVFEPFFTTKDKAKGTGLGLATVLGIVQQSGGNVWVYSEPGLGSTFKVYLPRVESGAEAARPPASEVARGSETVLLVEDEEPVRRVAHDVLVRQGYVVLVAGTPEEAVQLCEQHPGAIDVLLSDVVMPRVSGPELAKRLVVTRPTMRVIFMSGYTDDAAVRHGVVDASVAYLQKPLTVDSLTRKLREVLDATPRDRSA